MCLCWCLLNICLILLSLVQADSFVRWVEEVDLWSDVLDFWVYLEIPPSSTAGLFWKTNPVNDPISTWFGNLFWGWWSALYTLILICIILLFFCCILLLWYIDTMPHPFLSFSKVCGRGNGKIIWGGEEWYPCWDGVCDMWMCENIGPFPSSNSPAHPLGMLNNEGHLWVSCGTLGAWPAPHSRNHQKETVSGCEPGL